MKDQFTIRKPEYLETYKPFRDSVSLDQIVGEVQNYIQKKGNSLRCLDSMAGTGIVGHKMKEIFSELQVVYQDKSKQMFSSGVFKKEDELVLSDSTALDIADKSFDIVLCRFGLNNVGQEDYSIILKEYIRVLDDDGLGILQDHFAQTTESQKAINLIETAVANLEGREDKTYVPTIEELDCIIQNAGGKIINKQTFVIRLSMRDRFASKGINQIGLSAVIEILKKQNAIKFEKTDDDLIVVMPIITVTFQKLNQVE